MSNLLVRDPFFSAPFRLMEELFRPGNGGRGTGYTPLLDVRETDSEYWVMADLPGVDADSVAIEVNDQILSISGTRAEVEKGQAQLVERPYGSFVRTLTLRRGVESDSIQANYTNGVLELRIPKPAEQRPKKIAIGSGSQKAIES